MSGTSTAFGQWMEQERQVPLLVDEAGSQQDLHQQSHALCRGLAIVLEHHGCPVSVTLQALDQACEYLDKARTPKEWLKGAKCLLTYPMAAYLRNGTPPTPTYGVFVPRSAFRRWYKQRLFCFNRRNTHLWYSWLQSKRAALPASDDIVEETYKEHFETLTKPDVGDDVVIQRVFDNPIFQKVIDEVRNAVKKHCHPTTSGRTSLSAAFESSRADFGQHGHLCRLVGVNIHDELSRELYSMHWFPYAYHGRERRTNVCIQFRFPHGGEEKWSSLAESLSAWRVSRGGSPLFAKIQGVLEPLKVRVISKGESLPYYHARSLQEAMHTSLRGMPCFRLIGRPLSPTDLLDLVRESEWVPYSESDDAQLEYHSVDYRGATDGISWKYTSKILDYIISGLSWEDQISYRQVLGPHELVYPPEKIDGRVPKGAKERHLGIQTTGQLMGSILSFPILCIAHLGLILEVLQPRLGYDASVLDRILINGDDGLYRGTKEEWDRHVELGDKLGLFMSVGKAYRHKTFLNINSTCFHARAERGEVAEIKFLNTGLVLGQSKVMNKENSDRGLAESHHEYENALVPNLNEIIAGALPNRADSLLKFVLTLRKAELVDECLTEVRFEGRRFTMTRNLFIHPTLGGMGVRPPLGWQWSVSEKQKLLAYAILESSDAEASFGRPTPGPELEALPFKNAAWDKLVSDENFPKEFGKVKSYSRKSAKWFQTGVLWCATNSPTETSRLDGDRFCRHRYVDVAKNSIVHGVVDTKKPKTVQGADVGDAAELADFRSWLNSSVLSAPEDWVNIKNSVVHWMREGYITREECKLQCSQLDGHWEFRRVQQILAEYSGPLSLSTRGFIEANTGLGKLMPLC